MDANTSKKTLSGVFVTLLVGSVFLAAMPAAAQTPNPSGSSVPVAVVDAGMVTDAVTLGNNSGLITNNITVGTLTFNSTYDLTATNLTGTTGTSFVLFRPAQNGSATTGTSFGSSPFGNPYPASADGAHSGKVNVTFPSVQLDAVGVWKVTDVAGANVTTFIVSPVTNLVVTLSQSAFTYTTSNVAFTITVSPLLSGETARLSGPGIPANTNVTGPSGSYFFSGPMPAVGTSTITATRDLNGDNLPEYTGSGTFTVSPAAIVKNDVTVNVLSGFSTAAVWNLTFPNGTRVFGGAPLQYLRMNLSVTLPNGSVVSDNRTALATGSALGNLVLRNATAGGIAFPGGTWSYDATYGNFSFVPSGNWAAGAYSFALWVNTVNLPTGDASDNMPNSEYTATWTLTPSAPATVNLDLTAGAGGLVCPQPIGTISSGSTLNKTCVLEATYTSGFPTAPGSFVANLKITGDALGKFPGVTGIPQIDVFTTANVTVSGDVLPGWVVSSYTPSTGIAVISGLVPTHVGGTVSFNVNWQNATTTATIPISMGAVATSEPATIVVDQTTAVSTTLKDEFNHAIFDGKMFWFNGTSSPANLGIGPVVVNTTGSGDTYSANLLPTAIGKLIGFGVIGQNTGSGDFRNFSYTTISVVPAHDVAATVTPTTASASVPTAFVLNATVTDGRSLGTTAQIYLLNATQAADLLDNGSVSTATALTAGGQLLAPYLNTANGVLSYNFTATLKPGTYWVYLCGNPAENSIAQTCAIAKHDNNKTGALPTIVVSAYNATFAPAKIADNPTIQNNASVIVTITNPAGATAGVNGTLYWDATANAVTGAGTLSYTNITGNSTNPNQVGLAIPIVNGMGQFLATGFSQGDIWFGFDPAPAGATTCLAGVTCATSLVNGMFSVVGPNIDVNPSRIPAGSTQTVTMTVKTLAGTAISGINIRICGAPIGGPENPPNTLAYVSSGGQTTLSTTGCTGNVTTNAEGIASNTVFTNSNGLLYLYLNDSRSATNITVFSGLAISWTPSSPVANDTVTLTVHQIGKDTTGEAGVTVNVTNAATGAVLSGFPLTTGANGQAVLPSLAEGNYTVTAKKAGFQDAVETIRVGPKPVTPPTPAAAFELSNLDAPATGTVGNAVTVKVDVTNSGTADGSATVLLLVDGAQQDSKTVFVGKGSKETAAFSFAFTSSGAHTVSAKLAGGNALAAKNVAVTTPSVSTGTTSTTTSTTSTTTSTTTTTSTPSSTTTTTTPTPKVPGFEVVALIGAIGAALLVLRRRS